MSRIRPVAHAVIRHRDRMLVTVGEGFCRCVGGGIEFGERSEAAVRRELREELGVELSRVELLGVLENVFDFEGRRHHEIVFAFDCDVVDPTFYERDSHEVIGDSGDVIEVARWVAVADFVSGEKSLVPDGLLPLIAKPGSV